MTTALILETHNLEGGDADVTRMRTSLQRLFARLSEQTRTPDELVITHRDIGAADIADIAPSEAKLVALPERASYYDAKNAGFAASSANVVVFADSDCWPDPRWLDRLLAPIGEFRAVAGRTSYRDDWVGAAASAIDFLYFDNPQHAGCTLNFYANNVAFERALFEEHPFPHGEAMYRGHCQMLGARLHRAGVPIRFAHDAHTVHRFPDRLGELIALRLLRGRDLRMLAPHLAEAYLPKRLGESRLLPQLVFAGRLASSLDALADDGRLRRVATSALMCAISAVDYVGALGAGERVFRRGADRGGPVLSYHGDGDRLAETLQAVQSV
jgi:hypothetical protein